MKEQLMGNLQHIIIFVSIIVITIILAIVVDRYYKRLIRKSAGEMHNNFTNYQFLRRAINFLIYVIGFSTAIYAMPNLRALAGSLLAGAGIFAIALGFAAQQALSNIVGGIFIIIFKPFRINDKVKLRELNGIIEDITLRHTVIRDYENRRIVIPNSLISEEIIINADLADERICKWMDISITYDSNIEMAKSIMRQEILNHPLLIDPRTEMQIEVGEILAPVKVVGIGEIGVNLRGFAWASNSLDARNMEYDLYENIKIAFDKSGIKLTEYFGALFANKPIDT